MKIGKIATLAVASLALASGSLSAATVTVDSGATWLGYMNVFNLPANGGAFQFGTSWGTADLNASFTGPNVVLSPNTIGDPDPYWYTGGAGGTGNKEMRASFYQESNGPLSGQVVTFTGNVLSNTFVSPYATTAFIKDFAPDYSSFTQSTVLLTSGVFSINLTTDPAAGRHVQFGFETVGPNVWATNPALPGLGSITIAPVPETSGVLLAGLGFAGLLSQRRRARA